MSLTLFIVWLAKHWRLILSATAAIIIGLLVWEIRSTYAERDDLRGRVASQAVELSVLRENAATAEKLRLQVRECLDAVAAAQGAADSWAGEYHRLVQASKRQRPVATPPPAPPDMTCETAALHYAQWLAEVTSEP